MPPDAKARMDESAKLGYNDAISHSLNHKITKSPMPPLPPHFFSLTPEALAHWLAEQGEKPFRLGQILDWAYRRRAESFADMSDLSKDLRARLADAFAMRLADEVKRAESSDGRTAKFVFALHDGVQVEAVAMRDRSRTSLCLSCQAGCAFGCRFCATGAAGPGRNLKGGEIVEQVWRMNLGLPPPKQPNAQGFTHVVFMGMGEPLRNLDAVVFAMQALTDERRFGIGARRITLSTVGIPSGIRELMRVPVQPHLAISLNSPFEEERLRLMPGTKKHPLPKVLEAAEDYVKKTGRHLTFEYVLLAGVNDTRPHARALAELSRAMRARVNLIPFNPVPGSEFHPPTPDETLRFKEWLEQGKAAVSIRFRRGQDIAAGCGQLRGN